MKTILLASNNKNKLVELTNALSPLGINVKSLKDLGIEDPVEDGLTFQENSLIKSRFAFEKTGLPTLADDTGFCIDSMNGFPGLFSARFAKNAGSHDNATKILFNCLNENNKRARFISCLSFIYRQENKVIEKTFEGVLTGSVIYPGRGANGFGYCPYFIPDGYNETLSEMPDTLREKINHRGLAIKKFLTFLEENTDI